MSKVAHLHFHTEYSLKDGMNKIKESIKYAKDKGIYALAITDHGNVFGAADFAQECERQDMKYIIGMEAYISPNPIEVKKVRDNRHIVLLAKNETGYKNLITLASIASIDGFYYNPRIDRGLLEKYKDGLIVLSACLAGDIAREMKARVHENDVKKTWDKGYQAGLDLASWYKKVFGDDFYLEVQDNGIDEQYIYNEQVFKIAKKLNIKVVATNDAHYVDKEMADHHDTFMALGSGTKKSDDKRKKYSSDEFFIKTYNDFKTGRIPMEAVDNTVEVADKCNFKMKFGEYKIPVFTDFPEGETSKSYLRKLGEQGIKERYEDWEERDELFERLDHELGIIDKMGFNDYFLIVRDFVREAMEKGYYYGPGRGCHRPGTKITMMDYSVKNIENVASGDSVITKDGFSKRVESKWIYDVEEDLVVVKAGGKDPLRMTTDHKMLVLSTEPCKNPTSKKHWCTSKCKRVYKTNWSCDYYKKQELKWVKAKDIKVGDHLCVAKSKMQSYRGNTIYDLAEAIKGKNISKKVRFNDKHVWFPNHPKIKRFIDISSDSFCRFAGLYVGNGWIKSDLLAGGIAFHSDSIGLVKETEELFMELFGLNTSIQSGYKDKKATSVIFYSKVLSVFLKDMFGPKAQKKSFPSSIMRQNNEKIKIVLSGLFDTDGHIPLKQHTDGAPKVAYSTTSESLANQVEAMFNILGFSANRSRRKHKGKTWSDELKVTVSGKQLLRLKKEVFNQIFIPKQKYMRNDFIEDNEFYYHRVEKVYREHYKGKVYDLKIKDEPSYHANGYVSHNSAAGSILSYALYITHIDPIEEGLIFERFLSPSRVSMPDELRPLSLETY